MELTQLLHRNLQCRPAATALVCGDVRRSHAALHERTARLAGRLRALGVQPGDRVAWLGHNTIEALELMFAAWWTGAIFCPISTRWSAAEVDDALRDCTPALLFADPAHSAAARTAGARVPALRPAIVDGDGGDDPPAGAAPAADGRFGGHTVAALIYTGGTTGRSKGVVLTHATLMAAAACRLADTGPLADSVALVTTPIFHIAALVRLLPHLVAGGSCVLLPAFRPNEAMALIEREGVTDLPCVPTMLQMMLDHPEFAAERLRSVRRLSYGAAPSAGSLLQRAQRSLPWAGVYQAYGMTESMGVATMSLPSDHRAQDWASGRALSAGRAGALVELRVADAQGADLPLGQVGEVLLRGPMVSPGYWNRPEETARSFRDGWLHTGDAGWLDADGYLRIVDRIKDMIVSGGENVYSAEVENALARHPAVSAAAVIGIPSPRWGEAVHAVVVLRDGAYADASELQAHCRQWLAAYKVPKSLAFAAALPLTAAGKVAKNVLRQAYGQDPDGGVR